MNFIVQNKFLSFLFFLIIGAVIYSTALGTSFHYDDMRVIVFNDALKNPFNFSAIWKYQPARFIPNWTFALNAFFFNESLLGYHLLSIVSHIITAFVVYVTAAEILKTDAFSKLSVPALTPFLSGLIFLVHPLQTQAVTYIVQRSAILSALFYVLSCLIYLKFRKDGRHSLLGLSILCAGLAMFSKQNAFTLPMMIVLLDFFCFQKDKMRLETRIFNILPFWLILGVLYFSLYHGSLAEGRIDNILNLRSPISHSEYVLTQFNVLMTYLRLLLIPVGLNLDYDYAVSRTLFEFPTILSFLACLFILGFAIRSRKKMPLLFFCAAWFFLTLSVESGLVNIYDVIYEHRLYLPMLGFSMLMAYTMLRWIKPPIVLTGIIIFYIAGLSWLTFERNKVWETDLTLWQDVVKKSPEKARAHFALGNAYMESMNETTRDEYINKAVEHYEIAVKTGLPQQAEAHNSLAIAYTFQGRLDQASEQYRKATQLKPGYKAALRNLGILERLKNKSEKARTDFIQSLKYETRIL